MSVRALTMGWLLAAVMLTSPATSRAAEEPQAAAHDKESHGLKFSRVFVPADRIADWPRAGIAYLPVKIAEFERLVGGLLGSGSQEAALPRLEQAEYTATVEGDVVSG